MSCIEKLYLSCFSPISFLTSTSPGENFTMEILKQLCYLWMHISQDPIIGVGQHKDTYLDRVMVHYSQYRPAGTQSRMVRSIETKWRDLKKIVANVFGCYQTIKDLNIFVTNLNNTLQKVQELYIQKYLLKKEFQDVECWQFWLGERDRKE